MFERTRRFQRDSTTAQSDNGDGAVATATEPAPPPAAASRRDRVAGAVVPTEEARLRQREEFGGINWGAAFFGWIVAIGIGVLLTAIVSAAGAAIGLTDTVSPKDAQSHAGTVGIVGGALLIAIAVIAYYAGGYVAGRMSRFDGARQGFATWLLGLVITLLVAGAGAILGDQYNVFEQLNLPRVPVSAADLTTGGAIALAAIVVGSLLAAIAGGKVGQRYHRRVDRAALVD
jgi:amino acid transporter